MARRSRTPSHLVGGGSVLNSKWVRLARTREEALNKVRTVIISSSGCSPAGASCTIAGFACPTPRNTLVTGYQGGDARPSAHREGGHGPGSQDGVPVLAEVTDLKGLSGRAGVNELMRWLSG